VFCVESLWTGFFHIPFKKAKRQAATPNAKLPPNPAVSSAQTSFPSLNPQASKPTCRGSGTRDRDITRLPFEERDEYLIRSRRVPVTLATRTLFCISQIVFPHPHLFLNLFHLGSFGPSLHCVFRTRNLSLRPNQPCSKSWRHSSPQSPIRPSSQTNTMRSSWVSRRSWTPSRTSVLFM